MNKDCLIKYLRIQKNKAKKLNLDFVKDIQLSPIKNKKYRVFLIDNSHIDYGSFGMSDYLIHKDENRRTRFHQRFHNNKGYNDPNSGLFYSRLLLW